ncbi:hypothetical protein ZTR_01987 [Talaromyces verruculosus]|nr:hypothetical protein ZTR_01987 [Talaromyces verruculosus]
MSTSTLPDYAQKASLDTDSLAGYHCQRQTGKRSTKRRRQRVQFIIRLFALQQIASLGTTLWIKEWALQSDLVQDLAGEELAGTTGESANADEVVKINHWFYITVYTGLCCLYALITIIRDLITFHGSLKASSSIFENLLDLVLHTKLQFFDSVPLGQITNRFSKDVEAMDQVIPGFAISALQPVATITMVVVFISVVLPAFLIVAAFICMAYYFVLAIYINGARDLKRIEAVQRSPLFQQFGETLSGIGSLLTDSINHIYFSVLVKNGLHSESRFWGLKSIDFGSAGLVLTYSTTFTEIIMWFVQVYAFIQQNLNSVDRILEYSKIEQEHYKPRSTAIYDMPADWPSQGGIRFVDYTTRDASDLNTALSKVNFEAKPGQRIGIVGRTGVGKSTLTLALARCLEAESGRIEIDRVDISTLPLDKLRQAIAIVPQNPELFDGTIRDNLDPLQRYTDDEVISVLYQVHLFDQINATIAAYDHIVVLDSGRIVEQGSVRTLLARDSESSVFRQMCEESGDLEVVEHSAF